MGENKEFLIGGILEEKETLCTFPPAANRAGGISCACS